MEGERPLEPSASALTDDLIARASDPRLMSMIGAEAPGSRGRSPSIAPPQPNDNIVTNSL